MDENLDTTQEFNLEDILNEFRDPAEVPAAPPPEEPAAEAEAPAPAEPAATEAAAEATVTFTPVTAGNNEPTVTLDISQTKPFAPVTEEAEASPDPTLRLDDLSKMTEPAEEPKPEEKKPAGPIPFVPNAKLHELKRKLIAGPEKRFYDLTEIGVGKLQLAIFLNLIIVVLCAATTTLFTMGMVPDNRLRLVIFSQVLAMLVSGLLGCYQMLDGLTDLLKARFTVNTMLAVTFIACCVDAVFCLAELRVPCCGAFALEMTFALMARYHRRTIEMSQMDTLRKAVRLRSIVKEPDFYEGKPGILRGEADVEDFMDTFQKTPTPEKMQSIYAFISLILCLGIAAVAGLRHTPSLAVQVLSTALLAAVPASYFISITRPAALLEKRLHLVGSVICGWQGVRKLCGKAMFPISERDLFPKGSTKLNGVKFYGDRRPEQVLSYTTSLINASGSSLTELFQALLKNRGGAEYPVSDFTDYGEGGIGGQVNGEAVLMGSLKFMQDMDVEIPEGTMVNQAVYASINGSLCAVVAISYAKMRSASAGLISLCGFRKTVPVLVSSDLMLTEDFIHEKFGINTRRMRFPEKEVRAALAAKTANPEAQVLAIATRDDLAGAVYTVSGSTALRTACRWGNFIHVIGGLVGMLTMLALAYQGSVELLTPTNVLLYQLIWMIPGFLVTEWTRAV